MRCLFFCCVFICRRSELCFYWVWSEVIESAWTESIWVLYIAAFLRVKVLGSPNWDTLHFSVCGLTWSYFTIILHFRPKRKSAWINRMPIFVNLQPSRFFPRYFLVCCHSPATRMCPLPCALTQYSPGLKGQSGINITERWRLRHLSSACAELNIHCVHLWRTKGSISTGYVYDMLLYADMAILKIFPIVSHSEWILENGDLKAWPFKDCSALFTTFGSIGATHFHFHWHWLFAMHLLLFWPCHQGLVAIIDHGKHWC